jgi:ribosome-binding factor A
MKNSPFYKELEHIVQEGAGIGMFHPIHLNNYTFVMVCKETDYDFYCKDTTAALSVLNNVVMDLYGFFKNLYTNFVQKNPPAPDKAELYKKVSLFLEYWKRDNDEGKFFLSYNYIKIIGQGFDMMGLSYTGLLREEGSQLCNRLYRFDQRYKHLIKIDLYMDDEAVNPFFATLCNHLKEQPELLSAIERIEVANPGFTESFVTKAANLRYYPKIIIYPDKQIATADHPSVVAIQNLVNSMMEPYEECPMDQGFCTPFAKNTTITQGYRNYKKIMQVLNLLDDVYDRNSGYSFYIPEIKEPIYEHG